MSEWDIILSELVKTFFFTKITIAYKKDPLCIKRYELLFFFNDFTHIYILSINIYISH